MPCRATQTGAIESVFICYIGGSIRVLAVPETMLKAIHGNDSHRT